MTQARGPKYTIHDGFRMPMGFPVEGFDSGQRYRAQPGDVFVATYPKCGTTWMQYIVYLLVHGAEPLARGGNMNDVFPHLEEVGEHVVRALPEPRMIKTHLPFERTPWNDRAKYIYVARNPFDCVVSFYHHTRGFPKHYDFAAGAFDTFFELFLRGEVDFGDYCEHLASWLPQIGKANTLFLTYESMLAASSDAVAAVGAFLGGEAARTAGDARLSARVVELSSFGSMRRDQARWSSARPADMPAFVRKGVVGDWANHLSPEQARRLADKLAARVRGTPAEGWWPEIVTAARAEM
ncbi:MAG TPA: sulfotransferase domain-containing protein [Gammaproteobacteria bacterium]|nr:sulfotransferase domain-containing protein [Gammaproteobacteria bacterium]